MDVKARYESDDVSWLGVPDAEIEWDWIERKEWLEAEEVARQASGFANGELDAEPVASALAEDLVGSRLGARGQRTAGLISRQDAAVEIVLAALESPTDCSDPGAMFLVLNYRLDKGAPSGEALAQADPRGVPALPWPGARGQTAREDQRTAATLEHSGVE